MKMHLTNILRHFGATDNEIQLAATYFTDKTVSFSSVRAFLGDLRDGKLAVDKA